MENGDIMKENVCTLYYRTPEDGQLYGMKYQITESTEKGWQACFILLGMHATRFHFWAQYSSNTNFTIAV